MICLSLIEGYARVDVLLRTTERGDSEAWEAMGSDGEARSVKRMMAAIVLRCK